MAPIVHMYRSGERGLFVNSYLVEGAEGVVAVDAPLLLSDGRAFRARLEALRKPLLGVLVTHPHPDHYNTVTELLAGEDVPVIAHGDVDREIRAKDDAKRAQWGPMFGNEWPAAATFPNRTVSDEESVELGEMRFTAWDFGPCESESETVWLLGDGDIAFVGDLAFNGTHAYLADGHTDAWLRAIDRAEEALAGVQTLYVGHGAPTIPTVLSDQRRYLLMAREAIGRVAGGRAHLSDDEADRVVGLMERYLPSAPLSWLVAAGAPAVAAELASEPAAT
ncbi:MAG TPA: MBL fold metallo-hydrolase [Solirubrobacteraceae bacterium]|nr:MBL fold metallo-hydrolase [Solirubrobacteraceae bacterium]